LAEVVHMGVDTLVTKHERTPCETRTISAINAEKRDIGPKNAGPAAVTRPNTGEVEVDADAEAAKQVGEVAEASELSFRTCKWTMLRPPWISRETPCFMPDLKGARPLCSLQLVAL